ncbi:MAG TPA: hypothetical protein DIU00_18430 [Phycisphaerales bacterium]|nr:hypothetical protein [Phycisphaerales bacterium]
MDKQTRRQFLRTVAISALSAAPVSRASSSRFEGGTPSTRASMKQPTPLTFPRLGR